MRIEDWKRRVGWVSPELQADHFAAQSLEEIVDLRPLREHRTERAADCGGSAQRAALARILRYREHLRDVARARFPMARCDSRCWRARWSNDPELLLLDEPCAGLDGDVRGHVLRGDRAARAQRHADRDGRARCR